MKIYIVTDGHYSDYSIQKVFSNRAAAEDYKKYHRCDNDIEEYEVFDSMEAANEGAKPVMFIRITAKVFPEAVVDFKYDIAPNCIYDNFITKGCGVHLNCKGYFEIYIYNYIPAEKWDEELYRNRLTKALYDNVAIVKSMLADGANQDMINLALIGRMEEWE